MGCGCGCEHEKKQNSHKHCGKPMKCTEDKYVCEECGFEEECSCTEDDSKDSSDE